MASGITCSRLGLKPHNTVSEPNINSERLFSAESLGTDSASRLATSTEPNRLILPARGVVGCFARLGRSGLERTLGELRTEDLGKLLSRTDNES